MTAMCKTLPRERRTGQRRTGLYRQRGNNKVLIAAHGECTRPVEIRRRTMLEIGQEAAYRKMSPEGLLGRLLDAVAEHDLFAAVLED